MKLNLPMSIAAIILTSNSSYASTTHTMTDGRFDFIDSAGTITASGHNDIQGVFDMHNGTGALTTSTAIGGFTMHWDIIDMSRHNTLTGGVDTSAVEAYTFEWTNLTYVNSDFSEYYDCRVSGSYDGCDSDITSGMTQLGTGTTNSYNYTLSENQFANHLLWDWSTNIDVPVLAIMQVTNFNDDGSMDVIPVGEDCSTDGNLCGTVMATSPFPGQTMVFSGNIAPVSAVPVPAAAWLFGSGLIGLVGFASRKKS